MLIMQASTKQKEQPTVKMVEFDSVDHNAFLRSAVPNKEIEFMRTTSMEGVPIYQWLKQEAQAIPLAADPKQFIEKTSNIFLTTCRKIRGALQNAYSPKENNDPTQSEIMFEESCMLLYVRSNQILKGQSANQWIDSIAKQMVNMGTHHIPGQLQVMGTVTVLGDKSIPQNLHLCPAEFGEPQDFFIFVYFQEATLVQ